MQPPPPALTADPGVVLFGRPRLVLAGRTIDFLPERRFQMLAVLALRAGWVHRDELAALFWPEHGDAKARSNVRKAMFRIHDTLPTLHVESRGAELRWSVDSDVARMLRCLAQEEWQAAADLCRGPLLAGLDDDRCAGFSAWLADERQRFHEHARTALLCLIEQARQAGDHARASAFAELLQGHDPLDESAVIALCRAQVDQGRPEEAERHYRQFALRLADELGIAPSDRLRDLAAAWSRSSGAAAPAPLAPSAPTPTAALDCFVGRRQEAAELQALLARGECRLLSVVGAGGVGKSRLLREALPALQARLGVIAVWLPLDDLGAVEEMPARLATVLAVPSPQQGSVQERLVALLDGAARLVVCDNAEHLTDLAPVLVGLLKRLPLLRVALTTRARLRVAGEWVLPLAGLPVPDADSRDAEAAITFDAVRLFVERARQANPAFAADDIGAIADIVQRVDGLPLAIELAAAWTRLLPPREIAADLAGSIDLLEASDGRTSVRAVIERSRGLLSAREREVLAALSVFAGGFTPAMARRICDAPLPVLAALSDKSLLGSEPGGRLGLHPLVQHVMREHAESTAGWTALQHRHCRAFGAWLDELGPRMRTAPVPAAQAIDTEHANCRVALRFAATTGDARLLRPMANALSLAYIAQTRFREGAGLFAETLSLAGERPGCRAPLLHAVATFRYRQGELAQAEQLAREGLRAARRARDRPTFYRCLHTLALARFTRGDIAEALRHFAAGARRLRRSGDEVGLRAFVNGTGMALKGLGRLDEAALVYEEALALARSLDDTAGVIVLHNNIGNLHRSRRDYPRALCEFDTGLALARSTGAAYARAFLTLNRGLALFENDDLPQSAEVLHQVLADCEREPQAQIAVAAHQGLARNAFRRGDDDTGLHHLTRAGRLAHDAHLATSFTVTVLYWAEAKLLRGDRIEAGAMLLWVLGRSADDSDLRLAGELLVAVALSADEQRQCTDQATAWDQARLLAMLSSERARISSTLPVS